MEFFFNLLILSFSLSFFTFIIYQFLIVIHASVKDRVSFLKSYTVLIPFLFISFLLLTYFEKNVSFNIPLLAQDILPSSLISLEKVQFIEKKISDHIISLYLALIGIIHFVFIIKHSRFILLLKNSILSRKNKYILLNTFDSPFVCGLLRPKIYFPESLHKELDQRMLSIALTHEKIHIEKKDLIWKYLSFISYSLIFFSPFSIWLNKRFELEIEAQCDEMTIKRENSNLKEYGGLLLKIASVKENYSNMGLGISHFNLKQRIVFMKTKTSERKYLVKTFISLLFLFGILGLNSYATTFTSKNSYKIEADLVNEAGTIVARVKLVLKEGEKGNISLKESDINKKHNIKPIRIGFIIRKDKNLKNVLVNIETKRGKDNISAKLKIQKNKKMSFDDIHNQNFPFKNLIVTQVQI